VSVNVTAHLSAAAAASEAGDFREALKAMTHAVAAQAAEIAQLQQTLKREHSWVTRLVYALTTKHGLEGIG
jgi:ATPase subunit of ABC transporter with duplicated ATPase domains